MKEFACIRDFYVNDKLFSSIGDIVALLDDKSTIVNKNNKNQINSYYPEIIKDKEHFIETSDNSFHIVNKPKHYTSGDIECIDAMIAAFGKEAVMTFCKLNSFKYIWREKLKGGTQDMDKATWYLNKYLQLAEE